MTISYNLCPVFQDTKVTDDNNNILVGALLYSYESGTSNAAATYCHFGSRDPDRLGKFEALKEAYNHYLMLERLCFDAEK